MAVVSQFLSIFLHLHSSCTVLLETCFLIRCLGLLTCSHLSCFWASAEPTFLCVCGGLPLPSNNSSICSRLCMAPSPLSPSYTHCTCCFSSWVPMLLSKSSYVTLIPSTVTVNFRLFSTRHVLWVVVWPWHLARCWPKHACTGFHRWWGKRSHLGVWECSCLGQRRGGLWLWREGVGSVGRWTPTFTDRELQEWSRHFLYQKPCCPENVDWHLTHIPCDSLKLQAPSEETNFDWELWS